MLEQKHEQIDWIEFCTKLWSQIFNFHLIIIMIKDLLTEIVFQKYWFFKLWPAIKKILTQKIENQAS